MNTIHVHCFTFVLLLLHSRIMAYFAYFRHCCCQGLTFAQMKSYEAYRAARYSVRHEVIYLSFSEMQQSPTHILFFSTFYLTLSTEPFWDHLILCTEIPKYYVWTYFLDHSLQPLDSILVTCLSSGLRVLRWTATSACCSHTKAATSAREAAAHRRKPNGARAVVAMARGCKWLWNARASDGIPTSPLFFILAYKHLGGLSHALRWGSLPHLPSREFPLHIKTSMASTINREPSQFFCIHVM